MKRIEEERSAEREERWKRTHRHQMFCIYFALVLFLCAVVTLSVIAGTHHSH